MVLAKRNLCFCHCFINLIMVQDFKDTLQDVRPSVSQDELRIYNNRNNQFGSYKPFKTETGELIQSYHIYYH